MTGYDFSLAGERLTALGSGALWWQARGLLCVADLHLGKSERQLRRGGTALPPYETRDTLNRLTAVIEQTQPETVICLGDSFDDEAAAAALSPTDRAQLEQLITGPRWIWITGNHDPAPTGLAGEAHDSLTLGPLLFRHIAEPALQDQNSAEISGHYHPKARLRGTSRPAFLADHQRLILPAFGTYTGGLCTTDPALRDLMSPRALAILTGPRPLPCPMPR
ncbi:ligase-associated DNA damage response endonuclease PdeM [Phaeobacter gallaeciensis]|uniref:Phosphoesterase n=1 Tax=Phaeobacter gallaeciensis TaxID=60890 RepID=A0AAC9Z9V1_9RHOB|nr:ligase-associated DNA damage response endonuclease PdeM [Phaeobacter gallaeciensis]AHD10634.1 putative phosphoesterase [Phaeobacter gallaeciensis DSM 26640]ATE93897.1 putative phosphoesterase [Phaeobacter gallaeciensis]ATE96282.1 putative phosphoesterase [Phaeobacter gallaeciensis]ATF02561.1 putative phosphoesterase [Phaeobacter gallaeciensis]ATF06941.1 putative phosphoesterase [Phaeobacter gallaeciensis]